MKQNKLSFHTVSQVIEALKIEYHRQVKSMDLLNRDVILIRIKDIDNDIKILTEILEQYENGVNRGKTIIKGGGI